MVCWAYTGCPDYESQGKTLEELRGNLIEIYNDVSLFQGTQKLKKALLRESLRDYRRDASKRVNQTPNTIALQDGGLGGAGYP